MLTLTIHEIIQKITCSDKAEEYAILVLHHTPLQLQGYIIEDFLKKREIFDTTDWETIETAIENARWKSFFRVADRLNAPEFINYYINKYFLFRKIPANGVYFTFLGNKAQCTDAAYFTQFMLKRSGYSTFIRSVKWDKDPWTGFIQVQALSLPMGSICWCLILPESIPYPVRSPIPIVLTGKCHAAEE